MSLLFQGIVEATMPRGDAYLFMEMGKHLERAEKAARILDVYYHKNLESLPEQGNRGVSSLVVCTSVSEWS